MMRGNWLLLVAVSVVVLASLPAAAQDPVRTGLTVAYPTSVGLLWPVSTTVALRPEVGGGWSSSGGTRTAGSGEVTPTLNSDTWSVSAALSGLFYVRDWDALRAYVVPRFGYGRTTVTSEISTSVTAQYIMSGAVGLQHPLGPRFGIFAELGVGYTLQKGRTTNYPTASGAVPQTSATTSTTHAVGLRSGIGAVVYF